MPEVTVHLTKSQFAKLEAGKNIRVDHYGLTSHNTTLDVTEEELRKIETAIRRKKGCLISGAGVHAGQELEFGGNGIGRFFKKAGNAIQKTANQGAKYVHKNAGAWVEKGKKLVPKEVVQQMVHEGVKAGITAAATMSGQPELLMAIPAAQKASDYGTNKFYKHDFKKPLPSRNQMIREVGRDAIGAASKYAENKLNIAFGDDNLGDMSQYEGGSILAPFIASSYNPVAKAVLDRNGNDPIVRMQIVRTPLALPLTMAINYASGGKYNKVASQDASGKFYHLNANIYTNSGAFTAEKTEVVTLKPGATPTRGAEVMEAVVPAGLTIRALMDNTQRVQGSKYFFYKANGNNCQVFLLNMLQGSGMNTPALETFVKQATEAIFEGNTNLRRVANTATDLAAVASNATSNPVVSRLVSAPSIKPSLPKPTMKGIAKRVFGFGAAPIGGSAAPIGGSAAPNRGYSGGALRKGSAEAKAHMARLRAMRGTKGGSKPGKASYGTGFLAL